MLEPNSPIRDDGFPDVAIYNKDLEQLGNPSWLDVPWLFCECYLFRYVLVCETTRGSKSLVLISHLSRARRMQTSFSLSTHWKNYDIFARQKITTFRSSRPAVLELAARYKDIVSSVRSSSPPAHKTEAERVLFTEMCEICLWGNATDLSLLTSLSYEDMQKLQGSAARKASEANILVNDLPRVYEVLCAARLAAQPARRVDVVLDNAGFELFVDLVLAGYLLAAGLATSVVLHPKSMPWFVSDVVPADFASLLGALADPRAFYETPTEEDVHRGTTPAALTPKEVDDLAFLFAEWGRLHAEGQLILRPNRFWTHPGSFWRLPVEARELWEDLKGSQLVIFKGDLNYRKLTADVG